MKNLLIKIDEKKYSIDPIFWFLAIWLLINLVQSYFTELAHDEAYYWMYSRYLDWGYFDHPPVIALLIKAGYAIFPNELGVRLFPSILGTGTLFLIYKMIDHPRKLRSLYILLVGSIVLMYTHVGGFLAIPDIPMIFFSALFLFWYKKYATHDSYIYALLLGITGALMLYSKYQGLLVLIFTFLSNLKLVKRRSFWMLFLIIVLLMIPHLLWQIREGFPTFTYHLISRSTPYKLDHTINFLYSQLLIAGPFVAIIVLYHGFKKKASTTFERALRYNLIGIFVFFFLSSFKGRVEAHWTAVAYIPLVILSYSSIIESEKAQKWVNYLFIPSIIGFMLIRIYLVYDFLPKSWNVHSQFHGWDKSANEIKKTANGRIVVFSNTFQRPSKYTFYTKDFSLTLNSIYYRQNQYDLWPFEDSIQGKDIMLINNKLATDSILCSNGELYTYYFINNFRSYNKIKITFQHHKFQFPPDSSVIIPVKIINPTDKSFNVGEGVKNVQLVYTYIKNGKFITPPKKVKGLQHIEIKPGKSINVNLTLNTPVDSGKYECYISVQTMYLYPAFNSRILVLEIK